MIMTMSLAVNTFDKDTWVQDTKPTHIWYSSYFEMKNFNLMLNRAYETAVNELLSAFWEEEMKKLNLPNLAPKENNSTIYYSILTNNQWSEVWSLIVKVTEWNQF